MGSYFRVSRLAVVALVSAVFVGGCWLTARGIMQHRAEYPGALTFVGHADGILGVRYERVYLWRPPDYTDPLPALTVYFDDVPHAIANLTPEHMTALGGSLNDGGVWDSQGNMLRYRFEYGRLTYLSLDATNRPSSSVTSNARTGQFRLSLAGGEPFAVPVTFRGLVRHAGRPLDTYWYLAN